MVRLKARGRAESGARTPWERRRGGCIIHWSNRGYLLKREHMLIKVNISGSEDTVGDGIVAPITLGVRRVAEKDTCN